MHPSHRARHAQLGAAIRSGEFSRRLVEQLGRDQWVPRCRQRRGADESRVAEEQTMSKVAKLFVPDASDRRHAKAATKQQ